MLERTRAAYLKQLLQNKNLPLGRQLEGTGVMKNAWLVDTAEVIWMGDLDLLQDAPLLQDLADCLGCTLAVVPEQDAYLEQLPAEVLHRKAIRFYMARNGT